MMAERGDFMMVHEPFSYLAEFGYADIAGERITSAGGLIFTLSSLAERGRVFAKETMGRRYPEVLADQQFLATGASHAFLIRHPREAICSYHALDPGAGLHKIGSGSQHEIFAEVRRLSRRDPIVVDSDDLITHPAAIIQAFCARVGIDFRPEAFTWWPSDRPEWQPSRRWPDPAFPPQVHLDLQVSDITEAEARVLELGAHACPAPNSVGQSRLLSGRGRPAAGSVRTQVCGYDLHAGVWRHSQPGGKQRNNAEKRGLHGYGAGFMARLGRRFSCAVT
jgi:hypothetical protein